MFEVHDLRAGYGKIEVIHSVSINVDENEIVCIIGPNGSGKSTLLKSIFGLIPIYSGKIIFEGKEITYLEPEKKANMRIAYIPQDENIFPSLSVKENLEIASMVLPKEKREERIINTLKWFPNLAKNGKKKASKLSGGEQQLLALARAFIVEPKLILLDEPSLGLAPMMIEEIYNHIIDINRKGTAFLIVEQNAKKALKTANKGYVLDLGKNRFEDSGEGLLNNQEVQRLYLGG